MSHESIPLIPASESTFDEASRSAWVYYPNSLLQRSEAETELHPDRSSDTPPSHTHEYPGFKSRGEEKQGRKYLGFDDGPSLFQEVFFYCTVKRLGDLPGGGCIYVEAVVDRDSGIAFAKVYSAKNAMNAVDILATRVLPHYERQGIAIKEIHTRKTSEYCGLPLAHPYETFLATSHIQHLPMDLPGHPHNHLCEQFYRLLLKEFFLAALRKKFTISLDELQRNLDTFVGAYNALQMTPKSEIGSDLHAPLNFSVDL